tara:strand:- start:240 stop:707 length:468 start_codon:yes stop_codon:yes gene_type:complete
MFRIFFFLFFVCIFFKEIILYSGDLTKQKPITKKVFFKGQNNTSYFFEPSILEFNVGKLYKLELINQSDAKHYFTSTKFSDSIFTRKVQLVLGEKKVAEIKGTIREVEVFPSYKLEWWFVPVKTGEFNDLECNVKNKINHLSHKDMGMVGKIVIK